jgi:ubiquinone/menaquinone biosynthesis C-methylase UbiE
MIEHVIIYSLGAYVVDVVLRPELVARQARQAAGRLGKPLLNVGAGTPGSSLRVAVLGPTAWGDVNTDLAERRLWSPHAGREVRHGDVQALPFRDKQFGAVIASHVLEHVPDPRRALSELRRVADEVYVICPRWWAPHTWLHPGHRWYLRRDGTFERMGANRALAPRAALAVR